MFSKLAREFSTPLFLAGLYFVFILVSRFYRLALVYNSYPHLQIWKEPDLPGLYATMKCAAVVYYCAVVWSMQRLYTRPNLSPRNRVIWRPALIRLSSGLARREGGFWPAGEVGQMRYKTVWRVTRKRDVARDE